MTKRPAILYDPAAMNIRCRHWPSSAWLLPVAGLIFLTLGPGCGCRSDKIDSRSTVHVAVLGNGMVRINETSARMETLAKTLRAMGARPATPLVVSIPKTANVRLMQRITRDLASAGYRRIIFSRPQEMEAEIVSNPASPSPKPR